MPKRSSKKAKRPERDANQTAHDLVRRSTEGDDKPSRSEISRVMAAMGRKGGKIGGKRRLVTMTDEERSEVALKAAKARWLKAKSG